MATEGRDDGGEPRHTAAAERKAREVQHRLDRIEEFGRRQDAAHERRRAARTALMERVMSGTPAPTDAPAEPKTRARIQQVALQLFIEQGYDATSLREIAERLGLTKAALYYHFKSKDEIITSLIDDRLDAMDELLEWARDLPRTLEARQEIIRRYARELHDQKHHLTMRFMERNPTALKQTPIAERMRERVIKIQALLCDPTDPVEVRLKSSLAIFALHATWFVLPDADLTDERRQQASLAVALELLQPPANQ